MDKNTDAKNKIDWRTKLTSRKFWTAIVGFVTPILVAFGCTDNVVTQATGIIMAGGTLIAYIIGEGLVDSSRAAANTSSHINSTNTSIRTTEENKEN